eukprot:COSAG06_NODE_4267_length_4417_cov_178.270496_4_plen_112_part_00
MVDALNPNVGQVVQKQMAELLTMGSGNEERQIGFQASERARFIKAWSLAILYKQNSAKQKIISDILSYVMMLLSVFLVGIVVAKQSRISALDNGHGMPSAQCHTPIHLLQR